MECSTVPLHENPAANPEETITPDNREDESLDGYRTAFLDSTRVNQTELTNLSSFSPIGNPQMNRTQSLCEEPSNAGPSGLAKSTSEPIRLNLDQFDDSLADLNTTNLLGEPVPRTVNSIIQTAEAAPGSQSATVNDAATAQPTNDAESATTSNDPATANEPVTANDPTTANDPVTANDAANSADGDSETERRYPKRKRTPPKRFGW